MSEDSVTVDRSEGVATVTLDDQAHRNAFDLRTADELIDAATRLGADPEVRCVVLTHAGEFFGTGADLTQLSGAASDAADLRQLAGRLHEAILQFHQAPVPVIGGINGVAAGAGFGLALGTASRLVTESFDRSLEAQLAAETDAIGQAAGTTDYERGFAAFFGDGDPEFVGE